MLTTPLRLICHGAFEVICLINAAPFHPVWL